MVTRKFPRPGYYRTKRSLSVVMDDQSIIFCTGTTKGNKYRRKMKGEIWGGFTGLCWMSVPSIDRAEEEFDFFETEPRFTI